MPTYRRASELDFRLRDLARVPAPDRILMADPEHFDVAYALNPHMLEEDGALKQVDRARARRQWSELRATFERLGYRVDVVPPAPGPLPGQRDLVFCANQALPLPAGGAGPRAVPSRMASAERAPEVPHVTAALRGLGYRVEPLEGDAPRLEGMGDGLWHPGRRLLWAGVGSRSSAEAWEELAERYALHVVVLELCDEDFYHLDTCLCLLDEETCLWCPEALAAPAQELVRALFSRCIEADPAEARALLACNAFCPDRRHVVVQSGCEQTARRLIEAGYEVIEVETGEFLKSGGSVFCMKLFHGPL